MQRQSPAVVLALGPVLWLLSGCQGCGRANGPPPTPAACAASQADLDRREAAVALRERAVELREKAVTDREAKLQAALISPTPLAPAAPPAPPTTRPAQAHQTVHSEQEAELAHRRVQNEMEAKGLLPADLPADAARFDEQIYSAMRAGEYDRAVDLSDRLGRAVAAVQVDQAFLDAKMRRVAALRGQKRVAPPRATEIDSLLQEVTSLAADGQYGSANQRVNRIAAILQ